jgi:hypothetical protein
MDTYLVFPILRHTPLYSITDAAICIEYYHDALLYKLDL